MDTQENQDTQSTQAERPQNGQNSQNPQEVMTAMVKQPYDPADVNSWTIFDRLVRIGTSIEVMAQLLELTTEEVRSFFDSDEFKQFIAVRTMQQQEIADSTQELQLKSENKAWKTLERSLKFETDVDAAVHTIKLMQAVPRLRVGGNKEGLRSAGGHGSAGSVHQLQAVRITKEVAEIIESGSMVGRVSPTTDNIISVPTVVEAEEALGVKSRDVLQQGVKIRQGDTFTDQIKSELNGIFE